MLSIPGKKGATCEGFSRRELLRAGGAGLLGLSLPSFLELRAATQAVDPRAYGSGFGKAKNVILLYLLGGAATQDMFDLKPDAPAEVRSQFKPIASNAAGIEVCEHLPQPALWLTVRTIAALCIHRAICGRCSQISMPGALVAIGLNWLRTSVGASGFRSNIS